MKFKLPEPIIVNGLLKTPMYTEAQLKQSLRDVLEDAALLCESRSTPRTAILLGAADAIRTMIRDIK